MKLDEGVGEWWQGGGADEEEGEGEGAGGGTEDASTPRMVTAAKGVVRWRAECARRLSCRPVSSRGTESVCATDGNVAQRKLFVMTRGVIEMKREQASTANNGEMEEREKKKPPGRSADHDDYSYHECRTERTLQNADGNAGRLRLLKERTRCKQLMCAATEAPAGRGRRESVRCARLTRTGALSRKAAAHVTFLCLPDEAFPDHWPTPLPSPRYTIGVHYA